jgi:hypothetical protein
MRVIVFVHFAASLALSAFSALLVGCGGDEPSGASSGEAGPTYHADVRPIVAAKCVGCHSEDGIAPFPLTTYAEVKALAGPVKVAVAARAMPPWPPSDDCASYDGARALTQAQIDTLVRWVEGGAAEGDAPRGGDPSGPSEPGLSRVDLTLGMSEAYTPQLSPDEYRCFLLDWPEERTSYVTGLSVEPGAAAIVHHVIVFLAGPDQVATYQALDDADVDPGWPCFGGPGAAGSARSGWVGGWTPGSRGTDFPKGTGVEITPGSKLIVQMHYNTSTTKPAPDRTKLLLRVDDSVEKKAVMLPFADPAWISQKTMSVPAHASDVEYSFSLDITPFAGLLTGGVLEANQPFTVHSAGLHMHTRGLSAVTKIRRDAGDECLLDIDDWDFHWQGSYRFAKPKVVRPGDALYLACHFENQGARDVNWGEGTADEMCLGTYYVTR